MNSPAAVVKKSPVISSNVMGMIIFLGTEVMFFAALISAYTIIRSTAFEWPPLTQPRLPIQATAINTLFLLLSAVSFFLATPRNGAQAPVSVSKKYFLTTIALGSLFLVLQGYEWVELIHFGLTLSSSNYGGLFYLIVGAHGIHVLGAIIFLVTTYQHVAKHNFLLSDSSRFTACRMLWYFVVAVWPILYFFVYLS